MKKTLFIFSVLISVILVGCGAGDNTPEEVNNETEQAEAKETKADEEDTNETADVTLPDGFPADFPIPDEFTITKVQDKSNEEKNHYSIDFDFDPAIDMESVFELYKAYSEKLGYNIVAGGEEYFAEDIFQFGANEPKSASNMFMVTLGTVDNIYGNIDVRFSKD